MTTTEAAQYLSESAIKRVLESTHKTSEELEASSTRISKISGINENQTLNQLYDDTLRLHSESKIHFLISTVLIRTNAPSEKLTEKYEKDEIVKNFRTIYEESIQKLDQIISDCTLLWKRTNQYINE